MNILLEGVYRVVLKINEERNEEDDIPIILKINKEMIGIKDFSEDK